MKKILSVILALAVLLSMFVIVAFAESYNRPFYSGAVDSKTFRIPAIYTLDDGSVIAVADKRYDEGLDSPANIDIVYAISQNGYTDWKYGMLNHFEDYADGATSTKSASFIDSAVVQAGSGRVFVISDAFPSGGGSDYSKKGSGFAEIDGVKHMLLTSGNATDKLSKFEYYIGEFNDGFADVFTVNGSETTEYSVDEEFYLYKNGEPLYIAQKSSEGISVHQNVYYSDSELCCLRTSYLWLRCSDDNGKTWSAPINLNAFVKAEDETFLGIGPGRGFVTNVDGRERVIFCVYTKKGAKLSVSTIYSDDNGAVWHRGEATSLKTGIGRTSEAQIVELNDGVLRMFSRNDSNYIAYADSTDGGISWSKFSADTDLIAKASCMSTFINTSRIIDGKKVILASYPSNFLDRADGVVRVGLVNDKNDIDWISTHNVTDGFYAYSCLTELSDGNFALLYEDEPYNINYRILSLDDKGALTEINGHNIYPPRSTLWERIAAVFNSALTEFMVVLNMI